MRGPIARSKTKSITIAAIDNLSRKSLRLRDAPASDLQREGKSMPVKPTTLLAALNVPQLSQVAQDVQTTIVQDHQDYPFAVRRTNHCIR